METERFAVPEVLFNPSDVGINQVTFYYIAVIACHSSLLVMMSVTLVFFPDEIIAFLMKVNETIFCVVVPKID